MYRVIGQTLLQDGRVCKMIQNTGGIKHVENGTFNKELRRKKGSR